MIPRSWSRANPVVVVLGAAGAVAAAAPGFGQCCYSVAQFPSPINCPWPWGPDIPTPEALNDLGIWVGHVDQCPENDNWDYGLRWSPAEGWTVLPFPPGAISSQAFDQRCRRDRRHGRLSRGSVRVRLHLDGQRDDRAAAAGRQQQVLG